jgi:GT2 family glycosyltransferase
MTITGDAFQSETFCVSARSTMTTSVVICCYQDKRWDDLCAAVTSVLEQRPEVAEIVVVVDHNQALLGRVTARFPGVVVIENAEERGLSGARNTGIAASVGDLVAFLDDDAVADPDMFERLRECVEGSRVLGAVADIRPQWLGSSATWFPEEFFWVIGCTYKGLRAGRVRNLLGAAMSVRRSVFETVGGFNSGLGRNHSALPLGCEETEFCMRANRAHPTFHFEFESGAVCYHKVPPQRTTWSYFVHRCYAEGWSKAHVAFIAQAPGSLSTERAYASRTVPLGALRGIGAFLTTGELGGLGRAVAGPLGLIVAAVGYCFGRVSLAANPRRALALRDLPSVFTCAP